MDGLNQRGTFIISFLLFLTCLSAYAPVPAGAFNNDGVYVKGYDNHGIYYGDGNQYSGERGGKGNGATGGIAALLLVLANVNVVISLISKGITRLFTLDPETRESINAFNQAQKRYLKGLHYVLNPIAICMAVVHFHLSTCRSILPDAALLLFVIIGALGIILKFRLGTKDLYRVVYGLHCSWVAFSVVFLLLIIGHGAI